MVIHYVIYFSMAALTLVAVYAAAVPIDRKTSDRQREADA